MNDSVKFCSMYDSLADEEKVDCTLFASDLDCICEKLKAYVLADVQEVTDGLYEKHDSLSLNMAFDRLDSLFDLLYVINFVISRNHEIPIVFHGSIEKDKKE